MCMDVVCVGVVYSTDTCVWMLYVLGWCTALIHVSGSSVIAVTFSGNNIYSLLKTKHRQIPPVSRLPWIRTPPYLGTLYGWSA